MKLLVFLFKSVQRIVHTVPVWVSLNNAGWPKDECSWLTVRYIWQRAERNRKIETDELNSMFLASEYMWATFTDP